MNMKPTRADRLVLPLVDTVLERALELCIENGGKRSLVLGRALHLVCRHIEMAEGPEDASKLLVELADAIQLGLYAEGLGKRFHDVPIRDKGL